VLVGFLRELKAAMDNRFLLDEAVRVRVEKHHAWDLLSPAPGAGMSVVSRVIAEMGDDPARLEDKGGLSAFAGVAPKMHQRAASRRDARQAVGEGQPAPLGVLGLGLRRHAVEPRRDGVVLGAPRQRR